MLINRIRSKYLKEVVSVIKIVMMIITFSSKDIVP